MFKNVLCLTACFSVAACGTFRAQSRVDPIKIANYGAAQNACVEPLLPYDRHTGAYNLDCFKFRGETNFAYEDAAKYPAYRNRLASFLMNESNTICTREMGDLTADEAMVNAGLASGTTVLSTIGALVTGQFASNALAAAASGTNAIRGHINAEVYRNVLAAAVSKAIRQERDKQRIAIKANYTKDIGLYSVDDMLMEVNQYHQTCSFYRGLDLVITAVDRNAYYATDQVREAGFAVQRVHATIEAIDKQLAKTGLSAEERQELLEQRKALREHETALIKQYATAPAATLPPKAPTEPETGPAQGSGDDTNGDAGGGTTPPQPGGAQGNPG